MLEIQALTKYYRNTAVVNDVSFTVAPGDVTGYLGPNGSGKSTTVKMITGLVEPSMGRVLLDGQNIRQDLMTFRRRLGYVPEEPHLYSYLTGLEYLQLIGRLRLLPSAAVDRKANDLLKLLALEGHRHAPLSSYSKGMNQRAFIPPALLPAPPLLFLPEPLTAI